MAAMQSKNKLCSVKTNYGTSVFVLMRIYNFVVYILFLIYME